MGGVAIFRLNYNPKNRCADRDSNPGLGVGNA